MILMKDKNNVKTKNKRKERQRRRRGTTMWNIKERWKKQLCVLPFPHSLKEGVHHHFFEFAKTFSSPFTHTLSPSFSLSVTLTLLKEENWKKKMSINIYMFASRVVYFLLI